MRVRTISPRGYCYGVVDAMVLVRRVAANPDVPRPIHVLGMLVHNRQVTEAFEEIGVVCIDGKGKADLSPGAGGIGHRRVYGAWRLSARSLGGDGEGLHAEDATRPDVTRTHDLIRTHVAEGGSVYYVGVPGHPEPEAPVAWRRIGSAW